MKKDHKPKPYVSLAQYLAGEETYLPSKVVGCGVGRSLPGNGGGQGCADARDPRKVRIGKIG